MFKKISLLLLTSVLLMIPSVMYAGMIAENASVRRCLTVPDGMDLSFFEPDSLIPVLIDIVENDPVDAPYHDRVVSGALKTLGEMHVPETVDLLISNLDNYTTTCIYWLGTYSDSIALDSIVNYIQDEDPSVRYEAATALAGFPDSEELTPGGSIDNQMPDSLHHAITVLQAQLEVETDTDVTGAINLALSHLQSFSD